MQNPAGQPAGFSFAPWAAAASVVGEELGPEIADSEIREVVDGVLARVSLGFLVSRKPAVAKPCAVAEGQGALFARQMLVLLGHFPAIAPMPVLFANRRALSLFPLDGFRAGGQVWISHSAVP